MTVIVAVSTVFAGNGFVEGFHEIVVVNCPLLDVEETGVPPVAGGVTPVIDEIEIVVGGVKIEQTACKASSPPLLGLELLALKPVNSELDEQVEV